MAIYLGIDSGTQSTKALLVDGDGRVLGRGSAPHALLEGLPVGAKEQHPRDWIAAFETALAGALAESGLGASDITAIGISGQQHGFVPLDEADNVIRPAKLWCDTATAPEAGELIQAAGGNTALIKRTGNTIPAGFTASKIAWLRKHEAGNFDRLRTILLPHDYLNFHLTGERRMEHGDASGTGLLNVMTREWDMELAALIDERVPGCLPPLINSWEPNGTVRPEVASRLGLSGKCLVSAGGGDNMMGAIGTGNVTPGKVTVSLGTSGTIHAFSNRPVIDTEKGEIAAFCDSTGNWLPLLCTMNVTVATEMVKRTFGLTTGELNEGADSVAPGSGGLMLLPYLEGERVPNVPDGTGTWIGYGSQAHTPAHFSRAAMEGAALGLGYGFARMKALGIVPAEIRLTGGGSRSAVWRSILAGVFGVPVVCTREAEGAALGAAIQARWCVERQRDPAASLVELCDAVVERDESTRATPDAAGKRVYTELQELHDTLSVALRPVFTRHRKLLVRG